MGQQPLEQGCHGSFYRQSSQCAVMVPWPRGQPGIFVSVGVTSVSSPITAPGHGSPALPGARAELKICAQITGDEPAVCLCCGLHISAETCVTFCLVWVVLCRCGGTVGAIFTCPLEVIKTRLQSSKLAFRTVYYPQVQLGTISGEGMVRPTSVSPGLLSVLK